nr:MAG TPA: hypothetical protein [Caudoviricetes sp.]
MHLRSYLWVFFNHLVSVLVNERFLHAYISRRILYVYTVSIFQLKSSDWV